MNRGLYKTILCFALVLVSAGSVAASLQTGPIPDSATVVHNNLRWAYVSPVASDIFLGNVLLEPSDNNNIGWRYATVAELALRPDYLAFAALSGGAAAAVPYWNTDFIHVDGINYIAGFVTSVRAGESGAAPGAGDFWETVYVKDLADPGVVPEPLSLLIWGGLACTVGLHMHRRPIRER